MAFEQELHFYPGKGSRKLVLLKQVKDSKGKVIQLAQLDICDAVGGPETIQVCDVKNCEPTIAGKYIIGKSHSYSSPTWAASVLKWGTPLKVIPTGAAPNKATDVWYKLPSGKWGSILKDFGYSPSDIAYAYSKYYSIVKIPDKWVLNDFGPIAIRYFKDLNDNRILDGKEKLEGRMIHTTPKNEAQTILGKKVKLEESHGCIHIKPKDRDRFISKGAFDRGTTFIIHKYSETYHLPKPVGSSI